MLTVGPIIDGTQRFTCYHVVGDLISSHMANSAARVVRVKCGDLTFGGLKTHELECLDMPWYEYVMTVGNRILQTKRTKSISYGERVVKACLTIY